MHAVFLTPWQTSNSSTAQDCKSVTWDDILTVLKKNLVIRVEYDVKKNCCQHG